MQPDEKQKREEKPSFKVFQFKTTTLWTNI